MAFFAVNSMHGEIPIKDARILPNSSAQIANDMDLLSGKIKPLMADKPAGWANTVAGAIGSLYRFSSSTPSPKFIEWLAANVSVVRGAEANNTNERTYFTGDGTPKKIDATRVSTTGNITPLEMGLPAPTVAPTFATVPNVDEGLNETTQYVVTYVSSWGEESAASPPSSLVKFNTVPANGITTIYINVLSLPTAPPIGAYDIVNYRIYRLATGFNGTAFQFVTEQVIGVTSYIDTTNTSDLSETLPVVLYTPPPATMKNLTSMPNGVMVASNGADLLFCEPYQPHAWPVSYMLHVDSDIVGLSAFGNSLLVATADVPYIVTGVHPSAMSLQKLEVNQSCISHASIVDMGYYAVYASPDGLVSVGNSGAKVQTLDLFTRTQWQALNPSTIHAYYSDNRYIAFYDATAIGGAKGGFVLDPNHPEIGIIWLSSWFQSGYSDSIDDTLYLMTENIPGVQVGNIVAWNAGITAKTYVWKSKVFTATAPTTLACGQVRASAYPVTCKVYGDGVLWHTQTVLNDSPFRLPGGSRATEWEVEVTGTATITSISIANSMAEIGALAI